MSNVRAQQAKGDAVFQKMLKWGLLLLAAIAIWVATILVATAVVKSRVPVSLSPMSHVFSIQENYAWATGTWVIEGQKQAFPLQTTQIRCEKEMRRCTAGTAIVMVGDQLNVDVSVHEVISWEKSRIVFVDDSPKCVQYVYTIDLVTKVANGVRRKRQGTQDDSANCAAFEQELQLSLKGGFREVFALENEAMPWFGKLALAPLKLFH